MSLFKKKQKEDANQAINAQVRSDADLGLGPTLKMEDLEIAETLGARLMSPRCMLCRGSRRCSRLLRQTSCKQPASRLPQRGLARNLSAGIQRKHATCSGTGTFGRVRLVKHKGNGKYYALKVLKKHEVIRLKQVEHIMSEKAILSMINHPFIVRLYASPRPSRVRRTLT